MLPIINTFENNGTGVVIIIKYPKVVIYDHLNIIYSVKLYHRMKYIERKLNMTSNTKFQEVRKCFKENLYKPAFKNWILGDVGNIPYHYFLTFSNKYGYGT